MGTPQGLPGDSSHGMSLKGHCLLQCETQGFTGSAFLYSLSVHIPFHVHIHVMALRHNTANSESCILPLLLLSSSRGCYPPTQRPYLCSLLFNNISFQPFLVCDNCARLSEESLEPCPIWWHRKCSTSKFNNMEKKSGICQICLSVFSYFNAIVSCFKRM